MTAERTRLSTAAKPVRRLLVEATLYVESAPAAEEAERGSGIGVLMTRTPTRMPGINRLVDRAMSPGGGLR